MRPDDDQELLARYTCLACERSFAALVDRFSPMVFATCQRSLPVRADAEDATQRVFMVLARKAGSVRSESLGAWLHATALRCARDIAKHNRRLDIRHQRLANEIVPGRDPLPDPQGLGCLRRDLDQAISELPDLQRRVVLSYGAQAMSRRATAAALGVPESEVRQQWETACRSLRRILGTSSPRYAGAFLGAHLATRSPASPLPPAAGAPGAIHFTTAVATMSTNTKAALAAVLVAALTGGGAALYLKRGPVSHEPLATPVKHAASDGESPGAGPAEARAISTGDALPPDTASPHRQTARSLAELTRLSANIEDFESFQRRLASFGITLSDEALRHCLERGLVPKDLAKSVLYAWLLERPDDFASFASEAFPASAREDLQRELAEAAETVSAPNQLVRNVLKLFAMSPEGAERFARGMGFDPALTAELHGLANAIANDPSGVADRAVSQLVTGGGLAREEAAHKVFESLFDMWPGDRLHDALDWAGTALTDPLLDPFKLAYIARTAPGDLDGALAVLQEFRADDGVWYRQSARQVASTMARAQGRAGDAEEFVRALDGPARDAAFGAVLEGLATRDTEASIRWLGAFDAERALYQSGIATLLRSLPAGDAASAVDALFAGASGAPASPATREATAIALDTAAGIARSGSPATAQAIVDAYLRASPAETIPRSNGSNAGIAETVLATTHRLGEYGDHAEALAWIETLPFADPGARDAAVQALIRGGLNVADPATVATWFDVPQVTGPEAARYRNFVHDAAGGRPGD